jgi:MarR family transcriptional regulator, organic hydroperoxide resistance regulator
MLLVWHEFRRGLPKVTLQPSGLSKGQSPEPANGPSPGQSLTPGPRFIDDYLLYLLARASHVVSTEFHEQLRRRGVSVPVWRVLASLIGSAGETVTGLAQVCLLQQPTMTKLLDRMVRDGLVQRTQDARDRRVVRVVLTPRGEALSGELADAARLHEADLLARHPEAEALAIKSLLRAILSRNGRARRR